MSHTPYLRRLVTDVGEPLLDQLNRKLVQLFEQLMAVGERGLGGGVNKRSWQVSKHLKTGQKILKVEANAKGDIDTILPQEKLSSLRT